MKISNDVKKDLYTRMVRQRIFEDETTLNFASGEMPGFLHLSQGEDAVPSGVCAHLSNEIVSITGGTLPSVRD